MNSEGKEGWEVEGGRFFLVKMVQILCQMNYNGLKTKHFTQNAPILVCSMIQEQFVAGNSPVTLALVSF